MQRSCCFLGSTARSFLQFRSELVEQLLEEGWNISAILNSDDPESLLEIQRMGVTLYPVSPTGLRRFKDILVAIKAVRADVLFCYFLQNIIIFLILTIFFKTPVFNKKYAFVEGFGFAFTDSGQKGFSLVELKRYFSKFIFSFVISTFRVPFDYIFVLNSTDLRLARKLTRGRVKVSIIPPLGGRKVADDNCCSVKFRCQEEKIRVLFVGRLVADKGYNQLSDLIDLISDDPEFNNFHFTIYGDEFISNPTAIPSHVVEKFRNSSLCDLVDFTSDLVDKLRSFDVLLMLSRREGASMIMQEAAHSCVPIIAHSAEGVRDFIIHGFNGVLLDGSDPDTIKKFLTDLKNRPEFYCKLAQNNQMVAGQIYNSKNHVDELIRYLCI